MEKQITVIAAKSQESLEQDGFDVADTYFDTIAQAKARAKYFLTEEYMNRVESTTRLGYAQVVVNGKVHSDFFAKEGK